jgi:hypothetical protein
VFRQIAHISQKVIIQDANVGFIQANGLEDVH